MGRGRFTSRASSNLTVNVAASTEPEWRNWQTRGIQNPVPARACGFDSHLWYFYIGRGPSPAGEPGYPPRRLLAVRAVPLTVSRQGAAR